VALPDPPVIVAWLKVQVSPLPGEIEIPKLTLSENPFNDVTVIVEIASAPASTLVDAGVALIWKSGEGVENAYLNRNKS
jgi:hypothetical protein